MSNLVSVNKMHYIVDECGNYYRVNGCDQLIVAGSRDEAGVFGFIEANKRIGGGRKAHFYSVIPVDENVEEEEEVPSEKVEEDYATCEEDKMALPYDMKSIDWAEYLTHFCYLASGIQNYQDELNQTLSNVDMQICDIMHYIELYNMDEEDSIRLISLLKECREQRRDVKDEMVRVEYFQKAIGTSSNIAKAKEGIKQINKLDTRIYHPRKLKELFKDCPEKTIRGDKLLQAFGDTNCMDVIQTEWEESNTKQETKEEGVIMEYTKQRTVFDGKENNWKQFAKQQVEFYANAEQYIYNLQTDINELENEIEEILSEMESTNYNAAQGYKVFKHLKELRNARKEKQKELECLYILTERFDCGAMAEVLEECAGEIETVFAEPIQEENGVVLAG